MHLYSINNEATNEDIGESSDYLMQFWKEIA